MAGPESKQKLAEWGVVQDRGRKRIEKAFTDPATLYQLRIDIPPPAAVLFPGSTDDRRAAGSNLPEFLSPSPSQPTLVRRHSFLSFPPEIRNEIYRCAVHYPSSRHLHDAYYNQNEELAAKYRRRPKTSNRSKQPPETPFRLRTPTILLLCKRVTREALGFLYSSRIFIVDQLPPWLAGGAAPLPLTSLVGRATLQNLRLVQLKIPLGESENISSGAVWLRLVAGLLDVWAQRNALVRLHVVFKLSNVERPNMWSDELEDFEKLVQKLSDFEFRHGARLGMIRWEYWVIDFQCAYRVGWRNPLIRMHPDPYIWQPSLLEWV
ncbi:hypothetical protein GGR52DRAFT_437877 [Hypoxylon sp. FL1284]|nr:hypothetical protein GGR52DRAFT_437877 [Hypoxylon sp. FL1284]